MLIPARGIFVIEVKGGDIHFEDGRFISIDKNKNQHEINPFDQVQRAQYGILNYLRNHNINNVFITSGVAFTSVKFDAETIEYDKNQIYHTQTATVTIINDVENDSTEVVSSETKDAKENTPKEELLNKGKEALVEQGFEKPTDEEASIYINNSVNFQYSKMGRFGPAFDYSFQLGSAIITINTEHELYTALLSKIYSNGEVKTTFELFLASFVKAVDETHYQSEENDKLVAAWNAKLKKYIMEQLNPRKQ